MAQNRNNRPPQPTGVPTAVAVEFLRSSAECGAKAAEPAEKDDKMPLFWRVFGGTVLSIASLVVMTAYSGFTGGMAEAKGDVAQLGQEIRKEITRLGEVRSELIEKDDFNTKMASAWRNLDELKDDHAQLVELRERCRELVAAFKDGEKQRRALERDIQSAREDQAAERERRGLVEELGKLRERLASLEAKTPKLEKIQQTGER